MRFLTAKLKLFTCDITPKSKSHQIYNYLVVMCYYLIYCFRSHWICVFFKSWGRLYFFGLNQSKAFAIRYTLSAYKIQNKLGTNLSEGNIWSLTWGHFLIFNNYFPYSNIECGDKHLVLISTIRVSGGATWDYPIQTILFKTIVCLMHGCWERPWILTSITNSSGVVLL